MVRRRQSKLLSEIKIAKAEIKAAEKALSNANKSLKKITSVQIMDNPAATCTASVNPRSKRSYI